MNEILIWAAGFLGLAAGIAVCVVGGAVSSHRGEFAPHEQMRERTPWPPPHLPRDTTWVTVSYDRPPRREPLALPRGEA